MSIAGLQELPGAFELRRAASQNAAVIAGDDPVCIATDPRQWAYAALFPLSGDAAAWINESCRLIVRIETTVEEGRIGFSVARPDLREFIALEQECDARLERARVEIVVNEPRPGILMVVRNTAAGGVVSRVQIHNIQAYLGPRRESGAVVSDDDAVLPLLTEVPRELPQGGGGFGVFESADAQSINRARLEHLASLNLPLDGKSVLDVGCGAGYLSGFFVDRGCRVVCTDARPENLARLKSIYPTRETHLVNVEVDPLAKLGQFDIVFCYGLIDYTENPIAALRNLASCCKELLLLETVITDSRHPMVELVYEPIQVPNQAVSRFGCRPSPAYIAMALSRIGFRFIYTTRTRPDFPDFDFVWKGNSEWRRDGHLLRSIFVASREPLINPNLSLLLEAPLGSNRGIQDFPGLSTTSADAVWLDIGAHLGEKTFAAAAQNPGLRVYAFEPNMKLASRLMGQLPNYVVLPMAVAEFDGSAAFYVNRCAAASSLLPFVSDGLEQWSGRDELQIEETISVPTIRLDTFLNQAGIMRVAFLKIDAQGADLAVIRSAGERLRDVQKICLEVQTTPVPLYRDASRKEDVLDFLTNAGFILTASEAQSFGQEENLTFVRRAE